MFGRRTSGHYLHKVIVSGACDKITVSHIKHFKTETRKIAELVQPTTFAFYTFFVYFICRSSSDDIWLNRLKTIILSLFWLILKSLNIHDSGE